MHHRRPTWLASLSLLVSFYQRLLNLLNRTFFSYRLSLIVTLILVHDVASYVAKVLVVCYVLYCLRSLLFAFQVNFVSSRSMREDLHQLHDDREQMKVALAPKITCFAAGRPRSRSSMDLARLLSLQSRNHAR